MAKNEKDNRQIKVHMTQHKKIKATRTPPQTRDVKCSIQLVSKGQTPNE